MKTINNVVIDTGAAASIISPDETDFGLIDTNGEINGLIGLDILMEVGAVIDLKNLEIDVN